MNERKTLSLTFCLFSRWHDPSAHDMSAHDMLASRDNRASHYFTDASAQHDIFSLSPWLIARENYFNSCLLQKYS